MRRDWFEDFMDDKLSGCEDAPAACGCLPGILLVLAALLVCAV